jgi:hypothetical protein
LTNRFRERLHAQRSCVFNPPFHPHRRTAVTQPSRMSSREDHVSLSNPESLRLALLDTSNAAVIVEELSILSLGNTSAHERTVEIKTESNESDGRGGVIEALVQADANGDSADSATATLDPVPVHKATPPPLGAQPTKKRTVCSRSTLARLSRFSQLHSSLVIISLLVLVTCSDALRVGGQCFRRSL